MLSVLEHDLNGKVQHALGLKNPPYNAAATGDVVLNPWEPQGQVKVEEFKKKRGQVRAWKVK